MNESGEKNIEDSINSWASWMPKQQKKEETSMIWRRNETESH